MGRGEEKHRRKHSARSSTPVDMSNALRLQAALQAATKSRDALAAEKAQLQTQLAALECVHLLFATADEQ